MRVRTIAAAVLATTFCSLPVVQAGCSTTTCDTALVTPDGRYLLLTPACDVTAARDLATGELLEGAAHREAFAHAPAVPVRPIERDEPPLGEELVRELTGPPGGAYTWTVLTPRATP